MCLLRQDPHQHEYMFLICIKLLRSVLIRGFKIMKVVQLVLFIACTVHMSNLKTQTHYPIKLCKKE